MSWVLLKNSLVSSSLATLLAVGFGLMAALWLAGMETRRRKWVLALAVLALALPPFLVTNCWLDLLGYTGVLRPWLPLNIFSIGGTAWILALLLWPITLFAVWSAWRRIEPAQLECDPALAGGWLIRNLLLPVARSALAQAAVLTFVLALNNFAVPAILQVKVYPAEMWVRFNTTFDTAGALQLSWPLVAGPLLLLFWFYRRDIPWPRIQGPASPKLFRQQLGPGWTRCCGAGAIAICLLSVALPLLRLVCVRRTWIELPNAVHAGLPAIWNSFLLAAMAATLIIVLALPAHRPRAIAARYKSSPAEPIFGLRIFLWLPFLLPGVLLGIALIKLFNHGWSAAFYGSLGIVVFAFVVRYLALGWSALAHAFQAVDRDLYDAARLEGATRWQMLRWVYWPQIAPQALAVWYVVFLLCLWDVESMILVVPPGGETLALRIFNMLHYGHNTQVNALCLTLLGVAMAPLAVWMVCAKVSGFARAFLGLATLCLLSACTPQTHTDETPLHSQVFSSARVIGSCGVGVGEFNKPRSVAIDKLDNLYAVDMTGRVQKFTSNGVYLLSWQMPQTDLGKAKGMSRDLDGNIIVIEPHYQRVNDFSPEGKLLSQWGQKGTAIGQLSMPRAAALTSRGEIFLCEYGDVERVQKFAFKNPGDRAPVLIHTPLERGVKPGDGPGEFSRPEGLCVDSQDRLYVADSCNHRIQIFSSDGKFIRAYGKAGAGLGELSYPYDICVDAAGRQYVCEFGNSRIQVFDAKDQPIEIIGGPGAEPGRFNNPWSIALDSAGNLYVADSMNHRVQKLIRK